ncbi:MAG: hypothetical protein JO232_08995 [Verrucomicrobia bacterium]|nr:hypothetical protein [Verrucomicrobiota bacterium]
MIGSSPLLAIAGETTGWLKPPLGLIASKLLAETALDLEQKPEKALITFPRDTQLRERVLRNLEFSIGGWLLTHISS